MDLTTIAAAGLRSRMESLEMMANNLANAGTQGYKTDREFYTLYVAEDVRDDSTADPGASPMIERSWTDFSQGLLRETGNALDVAFSGRGFLAVNGPSQTLYTRNGGLRIGANGDLLAADDWGVRDINGKTIRLDPSKPVVVDRDGTVKQDGQPVAQLDIVEFPETQALVKRGSSYFANSGRAQARRAVGTQILQGKLENSNVGTAEAAVRLVSVLRQFEMLEKALSLGGEMNRRAVEEVAKVGS